MLREGAKLPERPSMEFTNLRWRTDGQAAKSIGSASLQSLGHAARVSNQPVPRLLKTVPAIDFAVAPM